MRLLLGVTGGIAAYKAVELVRLATKAGHSVRVVQTPASLEFVGKATFEGITGAPVLVDRVGARPGPGRLPGDPEPSHSAISHLELVRRADVYAIAPASANTLAKLAGGHGRQPADQRRAGVARAAAGRARDEQPHVGPPGDAGQPRDAARARRRRRAAGDRVRWPRRASWAPGGWPSPPRSWPRSSGWPAATASCRTRWTACACWSPRAARASRSTRCASSATARRGGWASRWPTSARAAGRP